MSALLDEFRRHPGLWRAVAITGAAAFGEVLPQVLALAHRVLP